MSSYNDAPDTSSPPSDGASPKESAPAPKKSSGKMSDKQKADLTKHMKKTGLTGSEAKSHRMKMMSRMRKGMTLAKAHNDIKKSS
jgi:hypothetical protein